MAKMQDIYKQERKEQLDKIMREYYYEKNDIKSTIEFLAFMYYEYKKLA